MTQKNKTVGIYTLGCKVNQYESEAIAEAFSAKGFEILPPDSVCDVYVINTCTVTAESDRKAGQFIRRAIGQNPDARILVTGCFSQTSPDRVAKIAGVDYICGNADKLSVVSVAEQLLSGKKKGAAPQIVSTAPDAHGFEKMKITRFDRTRAYVKIEDGCENRCAYCIIPSARGAIRSKPMGEVESEVRGLTEGGCREIVLTGIETASYGKDIPGADLATLLEKLDKIDGIGRIRLGSLDPSLMKQEFVDRIAALPSLAPHFHLSMQSGSDHVLALMKRKYNRRMALDGMERLRRAIPGVRFTTDMIVGFPQESDEDFAETLDFVREAGFLMIHVFPYSRRAGTVADRMPGQIPPEVKRERAKRLSALETSLREEQLSSMTGKTVEVLFETFEGGIAAGHTPDFVEVFCNSPCSLHAMTLPVRVTGLHGNGVFGTLIE